MTGLVQPVRIQVAFTESIIQGPGTQKHPRLDEKDGGHLWVGAGSQLSMS